MYLPTQLPASFRHYLSQDWISLLRHSVQILVAWWFLAKIAPVFYEVQLGLGFPVRWHVASLMAICNIASIGAPLLIPLLLLGNFAVCFATIQAGDRRRHRQWNRLIEVSLFALVTFSLLAFARPIFIALNSAPS